MVVVKSNLIYASYQNVSNYIIIYLKLCECLCNGVTCFPPDVINC